MLLSAGGNISGYFEMLLEYCVNCLLGNTWKYFQEFIYRKPNLK